MQQTTLLSHQTRFISIINVKNTLLSAHPASELI